MRVVWCVCCEWDIWVIMSPVSGDHITWHVPLIVCHNKSDTLTLTLLSSARSWKKIRLITSVSCFCCCFFFCFYRVYGIHACCSCLWNIHLLMSLFVESMPVVYVCWFHTCYPYLCNLCFISMFVESLLNVHVCGIPALCPCLWNPCPMSMFVESLLNVHVCGLSAPCLWNPCFMSMFVDFLLHICGITACCPSSPKIDINLSEIVSCDFVLYQSVFCIEEWTHHIIAEMFQYLRCCVF